MNDEQKTPAEDDKQPADETPTTEQPTAEQETTEQPAAEPAPAPATSTTRSRNTLIASGAGLALVGGLVGFGIGHATAGGGDGDRFRPVSQYAPGEGRPGLGDGERPHRPSDGDHGRHFRNGDSERPSSEG